MIVVPKSTNSKRVLTRRVRARTLFVSSPEAALLSATRIRMTCTIPIYFILHIPFPLAEVIFPPYAMSGIKRKRGKSLHLDLSSGALDEKPSIAALFLVQFDVKAG